jgi:hypothetical protein
VNKVAKNKVNNEITTQAWKEYEDGKNYNIKLNLYSINDRNERFYADDQWNGFDSGGNPTPVFNIYKRVINYYIASILKQPVKLTFVPMLSNEDINENDDDFEEQTNINEAAELITSYMESLRERWKLDTLNRQLLLDAANTGDMSTYMYWNPNIETGQDSLGDIDLEIKDGVDVYFGNPNQVDKEKQPYILIAFRELVSVLRAEAKEAGLSKQEIDKITSDEDYDYTAGDRGKIELDNNGTKKGGNGKATAVLKLYKTEGSVKAQKSTRRVVVRPEWDTKLKKYPSQWANWDKRKNSYHGQAVGTGIVPNQVFINQQFSLVMIFMRDMAFPKVIYDKSQIAAWSNKVGGAFGVNGDGRPLSGYAETMTHATMNTQMMNVIDTTITYTKEMLGANDAALGDVNPDNARALAIVTEQAGVPLANIKANLYQLHEDIGYSALDFMSQYYGERKITVMVKGKRVVKTFDFDKLQDIPMTLKVEVGPGTLFSELAGQATMDNLLAQGNIDFLQWLDRSIPGVVPKKQELMDELTELKEAQENQQASTAEFLETLPPEIREKIREMEPEEAQGTIQALMQLPEEELQSALQEVIGGVQSERQV